MPQGRAKSGFPHEPPRRRLPLDPLFGMLRPGVKVVVEAVTMRWTPPKGGADRIAHAFSSVAQSAVAHFGAYRTVLAFTHAGPHRDNRVRHSLASRPPARAPVSINLGALAVTLALTGCTLGPNYSREAAPVPTHFKELKGWKHATPSDDIARGDWWTVYKDSALNTLLPQIEVSNQTVAAAAAAYEEARAVIREAQAALFPVATVGYTVTRTRTGPLAIGGNSSAGAGSVSTRGRSAIYTTTYTVPISGTWD